MTSPTNGEVQATLAEIGGLDRSALAERWAAAFGCPAPRNAQATLLRGALAWHLQMALASHTVSVSSDAMARRLRRAAAAVPVAALAPGTRLVREWQGETHHVTVLSPGFDYSGKTYRSLSAIARKITGTAWSGPAFFGLRQ